MRVDNEEGQNSASDSDAIKGTMSSCFTITFRRKQESTDSYWPLVETARPLKFQDVFSLA